MLNISQLFKLCLTVMINHVFISFSLIQTYDLSYIHLQYCQVFLNCFSFLLRLDYYQASNGMMQYNDMYLM